MHEIMHNLNFMHTMDLPANTIMDSDPSQGTSEGIYPGLEDIVDALRMYRPDSKEIHLYQFTVASPGTFSAETIAQRMYQSSLLNTTLTLFQQTTDATGTVRYNVVARNDDYFGNDSYLHLNLGTGTYFVGVTASGNNQYDPTVPQTAASAG